MTTLPSEAGSPYAVPLRLANVDPQTAGHSENLPELPSLAQRLAVGPLEVLEAVRLATQVSRALDHAHRHAGVVHRDVKPANLVFDAHGSVKLCDFGIMLSAGFALGVVLLSARDGFTKDLTAFTVGQILTVTDADLIAVAAVGVMVIALLPSPGANSPSAPSTPTDTPRPEGGPP